MAFSVGDTNLALVNARPMREAGQASQRDRSTWLGRRVTDCTL